MLYHFVKPIIQLTLLVFYRKIYFSNTEAIPDDKPIILAANHSNAMLDPILLAVFLKRSLFFMTRADIFTTKIRRWALESLHMLPIYRPKDGAENMHKNNDTFRKTNELLEKKQIVLIFSEGDCAREKRLRKVKTGTARMGFKALDQLGLDVHIVPVGINYTYHSEIREEVMIHFGEAIPVRDYQNDGAEFDIKRVRFLTEHIRTGIAKNMVLIESPESETLVERLLLMARSSMPTSSFPPITAKAERFKKEQAVASKVNVLFKNDKRTFDKLAQQTEAYFETLSKWKITDQALLNQQRQAWKTIFYVLVAPLVLVFGAVSRTIVRNARRISQQSTPYPDFYATYYITYFLVGHLLYFLLICVLSSWLLESVGLGLLVGIGTLLGAYLAMLIKESFDSWRSRQQFQKLEKEAPKAVENLRKQRAEIMALLGS